MTPRERLETALAHREPDRIPFDLGSLPFSGIAKISYQYYVQWAGLDLPEPPLFDVKQQLAQPDEAFLLRLGVDTRAVRRGRSGNSEAPTGSDGQYEFYHDEWQLGWRRPLFEGLYFDLFDHPLKRCADLAEVKRFAWPDPTAPERFEGLREEAERLAGSGCALILGGLCAGVWEMSLWLRGYDQFLCDMAAEPELAEWLIGKIVDLKLAYWEQVLGRVGDLVSVVYEADDLAAQSDLLVSPVMYRRLVKPQQRRLFDGIRSYAPHVKILYHTDGAIWELIPDLLELGIDILNPIQVNAAGMGDTAALKREFGADLCFWGGACDSQETLPRGNPRQVREEVKRRIGDLAPGGGYVFAGIHNLLADVPPANLDALWSAFAEEARYG